MGRNPAKAERFPFSLEQKKAFSEEFQLQPPTNLYRIRQQERAKSETGETHGKAENIRSGRATLKKQQAELAHILLDAQNKRVALPPNLPADTQYLEHNDLKLALKRNQVPELGACRCEIPMHWI